jgi:hypothetical protein
MFFLLKNCCKSFIIKEYYGSIKSTIVELRHQIVEIRQNFKLIFKNFQKRNCRFIFVTQSPNHKIVITIKIYLSWQQIQEES